MQIEDLKLTMIDNMAHLTISHDLVAAAAYAARRGYGDWTARRFVVALVMTDTLLGREKWHAVLRQVANLQMEADLGSLNEGKTVGGDLP